MLNAAPPLAATNPREVDPLPNKKTCTKCGENRPVSEYYRRKAQCKECSRAYTREWVTANKEQKRQADRAYYEKNSERLKSKQSDYYYENREADQARRRSYYLANEKQEKARKAAWQAEHAERIAAHRKANPQMAWANGYRQRARLHGLTPVIEYFTKADVTARYGDVCAYCETGPFEHLDHAVPVSKGGPHTLANVRPSCAACNFTKNDRTDEEFFALQAELDDLDATELEDAINAEISRWTKDKS